MKIDQDTAKKILDADFTNLMKQVKAGKPLTPAQRKLIELKTAIQESAQPKPPATPVAERYGKKVGTAMNMEAAAAMTRLSIETVKGARNAGCDAFHPSGRVDCDRLVAWVAENPKVADAESTEEKPNIALEEALLVRANRKIRERKLLEIDQKFILRAEAGSRVNAVGLKQKAILEKELKGKPQVIAKVCALMRGLVEEWIEG